MRTKLFLIIKDNSQRVEKKNFQLIEGKPLHQYYMEQRKHFDVYIDTDSEEILSFYESDDKWPNVHAYARKKEHIEMELKGDDSPAPLLIKRFLDEYASDNEIVVTSHITSPFLEDKTILEALKLMTEFDSVSSVESIQEFSVYKKEESYELINFSLDKIVKTQSLQPIYVLNGGFFIINKNIFMKNGLARISDNHFYYPVSKKEAIDIDTPFDLEIARRVSNLKM